MAFSSCKNGKEKTWPVGVTSNIYVYNGMCWSHILYTTTFLFCCSQNIRGCCRSELERRTGRLLEDGVFLEEPHACAPRSSDYLNANKTHLESQYMSGRKNSLVLTHQHRPRFLLKFSRHKLKRVVFVTHQAFIDKDSEPTVSHVEGDAEEDRSKMFLWHQIRRVTFTSHCWKEEKRKRTSLTILSSRNNFNDDIIMISSCATSVQQTQWWCHYDIMVCSKCIIRDKSVIDRSSSLRKNGNGNWPFKRCSS